MRSSQAMIRLVMVGAAGLWLLMLSLATPAQSPARPYQMSILATTDHLYGASVDIPIFTQNVYTIFQSQPAGNSIAWLPPDPDLDRHDIDWSRIVAVYVDEPYLEFVDDNRSCTAPGVAQMRQTLAAMAAALQARAPKARFWVNFSQPEIEMIRDLGCPFNETYIDVISIDIYHVYFENSALASLYQYVYANRATAHQQLALVPGTFTHLYADPIHNVLHQIQQAAILGGFFNYAAMMNQSCNLPPGPNGITGIYDGCPVWMIAGFMGGAAPVWGATNYLPVEHVNSARVLEAWEDAFEVPRIDPSRERSRRVRALIPLLLGQ